MDIVMNGESRSVDCRTVAELLELLGIDQWRVAVELNTEIVPKAEYGTKFLSDGDRIEIVHFVGGG